MRTFLKVDKIFLINTLVLLFIGFLIFSSASMGLLAKTNTNFSSVALKQIIIIFAGVILMFIVSNIKYKFYRKYAFYLFLLSLLLTVSVFVPLLGVSHGGATRWIDVFGFSFQPSELLKIGFIIYLSAWIAKNKKQISTFKGGLLPVLIIFSIPAFLLLLQPDTDTLAVILFTGTIMYFVSGASFKHIILIILIGLIGLGGLVYTRPYIKDRVLTLFNPTEDTLGSGYQINQSLIAVGSGGFFGRGFGQSVQKFNYLPEQIGDSIFAVAAEEFGFVGSVLLILLFLSLCLRGLYISAKTSDEFGRLLVLGIVILIMTQSMINISAMVGIIPLSGIPLVFVSHGGSAMLVALIGIGIVLNVSKKSKI